MSHNHDDEANEYTRLRAARDVHESETRETKRNLSDDYIKGTCHQMCSRLEYLTRIKQRDVHPLEMKNGTPDFSLFVKKYQRSSAGASQHPDDIRSPVGLRLTQAHLLNLLRENQLEVVYSFVSDRLRAIRKDISTQNLALPVAAEIYEQIIRFHLISLYLRPTELVRFQDLTQMNAALSDLIHLYQRGVSSENTTEFMCYDALLYITDIAKRRNLLSQISESPPGSIPDTFLIALRKIAPLICSGGSENHDIAHYVATLVDNSTPLGMAFVASLHFDRIRKATLADMVNSGYSRAGKCMTHATIDDMIRLLYFLNDQECDSFLSYFGVPFNTESDMYEIGDRASWKNLPVDLKQPEVTKMHPHFLSSRLSVNSLKSCENDFKYLTPVYDFVVSKKSEGAGLNYLTTTTTTTTSEKKIHSLKNGSIDSRFLHSNEILSKPQLVQKSHLQNNFDYFSPIKPAIPGFKIPTFEDNQFSSIFKNRSESGKFNKVDQENLVQLDSQTSWNNWQHPDSNLASELLYNSKEIKLGRESVCLANKLCSTEREQNYSLATENIQKTEFMGEFIKKSDNDFLLNKQTISLQNNNSKIIFSQLNSFNSVLENPLNNNGKINRALQAQSRTLLGTETGINGNVVGRKKRTRLDSNLSPVDENSKLHKIQVTQNHKSPIKKSSFISAAFVIDDDDASTKLSSQDNQELIEQSFINKDNISLMKKIYTPFHITRSQKSNDCIEKNQLFQTKPLLAADSNQDNKSSVFSLEKKISILVKERERRIVMRVLEQWRRNTIIRWFSKAKKFDIMSLIEYPIGMKGILDTTKIYVEDGPLECFRTQYGMLWKEISKAIYSLQRVQRSKYSVWTIYASVNHLISIHNKLLKASWEAAKMALKGNNKKKTVGGGGIFEKSSSSSTTTTTTTWQFVKLLEGGISYLSPPKYNYYEEKKGYNDELNMKNNNNKKEKDFILDRRTCISQLKQSVCKGMLDFTIRCEEFLREIDPNQAKGGICALRDTEILIGIMGSQCHEIVTKVPEYNMTVPFGDILVPWFKSIFKIFEKIIMVGYYCLSYKKKKNEENSFNNDWKLFQKYLRVDEKWLYEWKSWAEQRKYEILTEVWNTLPLVIKELSLDLSSNSNKRNLIESFEKTNSFSSSEMVK